VLEEQEEQMLHRVFGFADLTAGQVMVPRTELVAIAADTPLRDLVTQIARSHHTRFPVYRTDLDDVTGTLHVTDLVRALATPDRPTTAGALTREVLTVPVTLGADDLLAEMRRRRVREAIVIDEYGGTAGLVTIEDLLEEIVGEIRDEYDVESETVTDEGSGVFVFSGKVSVDEVRDRLGVEIEREGFETVGGYLLSSLGRMPYVGEVVEIDALSFEVLEVERRRVTKIRARRRKDAAATAE
jgi:CBS domain containing-hemolysin-like protein